ncbi:MAG: glycoside hydrolase family 38 C-terminal domain-containing protein [Nibricoccus sp.]
MWQGPDDRAVVAALDPGNYNAQVTEDLSKNESWLKRIDNTGAISGAFVDYHYFGTGDRGGAPTEDSVKWIERSLTSNGPVRVISDRADRMFNDLLPEHIAKLPRYKGEFLLTEHSAGSITSAAYMKRWNRKNELLADAAERASVAAMWLGAAPYPAKKFYDAWDLVLGSQMHDIIPGTSLPKAYEYSWNDEIIAANQFSAALEDSMGGVAIGLDTQTKGVPLVVFNPLSVAREDIVEAQVKFAGELPTSINVCDPEGKETPAQILSRDEHSLKIAFLARMPSIGFAVFDVRPAITPQSNAKATLSVSSGGLENTRYRVSLTPDGDIASIFDKSTGRELLGAPARLDFQYEKPELYPAWNMDWTDRQKPAYAHVGGPAKIKIVENGPVRVALEIERDSEGSRFVQTLRLANGGAGDRLEFLTRIDWQTRESSLKAAFRFSFANPVATYDSQIGTLQRGNNDPKKYEVPQHQWFDLSTPDNSFGVSVINDCKYGSDKPDDSTLRLTLLYTPGVRNRFQDQAVQDFGRHEMLYAVASHAGSWQSAQIPWIAARVNQPLQAFQTIAHPGTLGRTLSLFTVTHSGVSIAAVKKAEDSNDVVIRLKELTGTSATGVRLNAAVPIVAAREVDGQERPLGEAKLSNGTLEFDIGHYSLRAFALKLAAPSTHLEEPKSTAVALTFDEDVVSNDSNRKDGRFNAEGCTYPAEQLPNPIVSEGISFKVGSVADGQYNALAARGQTIALPAGNFNRLYFLAASDGETSARFAIDSHAFDLNVQDWSGYVGQWDNRLWRGNVPEIVFSWIYDFEGLTPGYIKRDTIAWYCSHRHAPTGNEHYRYSYLFKYALDLPAGAKTFTLPNNPKIRIFAITLASDTHDSARPAIPLYDTLENHANNAPKLTPNGGQFADSTQVKIGTPLYWHEDGIRYTIDGSDPIPSSPIYKKPLSLHRTTTIKATALDAAGLPGPVATATFEINDTTQPKIESAVACLGVSTVRVAFSEPVDKQSAETASNYTFDKNASVIGATLAEDGTSALLTLKTPFTDPATQLTVRGIKDAAPVANSLKTRTISVRSTAPVYQHPELSVGQNTEIKVPNLPVEKGQPWTMNLFVRATQMPANRTLIAGFGHCEAKSPKETGRYLALFANGLHFWSREAELDTIEPLTLNRWQMLTAVYDGTTLQLFADGKKIGSTEINLEKDEAVVRLAPLDPWDNERRFEGEIRNFTIWNSALSKEELALLSSSFMIN